MTNSTSWTKLVRFIGSDGDEHLGQVADTSLDVGLAIADGQSVEVYLLDGDMYTGTITSKKDTIKTLLPPVSRSECSIIRCLGLNYTAHAKEAGLPIPTVPVLFIKPRTALAGPGELGVDKISQDDQLDFETELALVVGKDALNVSEDTALDYVLGFTASNDVSSRKLQGGNSQWCFGKGLNDSCPIGPVLVRTSQADPDNLDFKGVLSGETVQQSNTSDMIFSCRKAIAFLSQGTTLERGSIIQMGTPSGIGWGRNPKRLIKDGEEMRIWFEHVGTLVNTFKYE